MIRPTLLVFVALYCLGLVVLLTIPRGRVHPQGYAYLGGIPRSAKRAVADTIVNVAVFLPLGWSLHRVVRQARKSGHPMLVVAVVCGLFSLAMETVQYFLPTRHSSITDVVSNTVGAALGAWLDRDFSGDVRPP